MMMKRLNSVRNLSIPYPTSIAPTYLLISRSQYKGFALLPHFIAPFSIFGSLAIIYRILRFDRYDVEASSRRTYYRLLVAMSICDFLGSFAFFFGNLPVPRETMLAMARGNAATCTAQGFLIHVFVYAVLFYNTGLMIYFVLTIRYGWTESYAATRLEPIIHVWSILVPLGQAIAGVFLHIFNPIGFGAFCEISPYPVLCGIFDACTRGQSAKLLYTVFSTVPEAISLVIIYISITLIYCTVRCQARRALAISANRDSIRARTRAVTIQSLLFALIFFNTWIYAALSPLLTYVVKQAPALVRSEYILSVLTSIFLPLQGFFNFCIYIRPRLVRLWRDEQRSFCVALKLAVFGGRETNVTGRRSTSQTQQRKRSSQSSLRETQREFQATTTITEETAPGSSSQRLCREPIRENDTGVGNLETNPDGSLQVVRDVEVELSDSDVAT
jgi:hypothetical protein